MKKSNIKVNVMEQTISVSKAFYTKASHFGTPEYEQLTRAKNENPSFTVVFKTSDKKTYNGLTLARMMEYIQTQENSEERMIEFEAVKTTAKAKGAQYPLTKKWFLNTYPEYKESTINPSEKAKADARAMSQQKNQEILKLFEGMAS